MDRDIVGIAILCAMLLFGATLLTLFVLVIVYRARRLRFAAGMLADSRPTIATGPDGARIFVIPTAETKRFRSGTRMPLLGRIARADRIGIGPNGVDYHVFHLIRANRRAFVPFTQVVEVDVPDGAGGYAFALRLADGRDLGFFADEAAVDAALVELSRTCHLTDRAHRRLQARGYARLS